MSLYLPVARTWTCVRGCLLMSLACSHRMRMRLSLSLSVSLPLSLSLSLSLSRAIFLSRSLSRALSLRRQVYAPLAEYLPTYDKTTSGVDKMLAQAHILKKVLFMAMSRSKCAWGPTFDNTPQELNCNCWRLSICLSFCLSVCLFIYLSIYRSLTRNCWRLVRWKRRRRDRLASRTSSTPPRLRCQVGQAAATHRLNATGSTGDIYVYIYICGGK